MLPPGVVLTPKEVESAESDSVKHSCHSQAKPKCDSPGGRRFPGAMTCDGCGDPVGSYGVRCSTGLAWFHRHVRARPVHRRRPMDSGRGACGDLRGKPEDDKRCEPQLCDRVHASPSLPSSTRQPAPQRQWAGCRIQSGNDGETCARSHNFGSHPERGRFHRPSPLDVA